MAASEAVPPLVLTLLAGGFTIVGVALKIGYDALAARRATKSTGLERFAKERRDAYEQFYSLIQQERRETNAIRELIVALHGGKTGISDEEQAAVPPGVLAELIAALDQVRHLARMYSVITAAEAIVQLFVDMSRAARAAMESPEPDDEITWFLLQRFLDDRISEFVHGYREDLGLGTPVGAPKTWPIVERERPWPLNESEAIVRAHIPPSTKPSPSSKPLHPRGDGRHGVKRARLQARHPMRGRAAGWGAP
jgi:hypothetical protein